MHRVLDWSGLPPPEPTQPPAERLRGPAPQQSIRNLLSSGDGRFHVGEWRSGVGAWRVHYSETEMCHLLEGVVRLSDDHGHARTYRAGDTFVVGSGFAGLWEVLEPCRKIYAIYE